jgi:hypothetical protein
MITSWNKFAHEMRLGRLLCEAHQQSRAKGFRGRQKDHGFKGFVESNGIPLRRAYRLMHRYMTVLSIIMPPFLQEPISDSDHVTNDSELPELVIASIEESAEEACKLARTGIDDGDRVTNAEVRP